MSSSNYRAALKSIRAVNEAERTAEKERLDAGLFNMVAQARDIKDAEKQSEKQQKKLAIANIVGTTVGIASNLVPGVTPIGAAAIGAGTTTALRRGMQKGWKGKVEGLTFASTRDALRKEMKPSLTKDIAVGANAGATAFQAGNLLDAAATARGMKGLTEAEKVIAQAEDFSRSGFKIKFDRLKAFERYKAQSKIKRVDGILKHGDIFDDPLGQLNNTQTYRIGLRDILKGIGK
jgi:hypothetical protein